MAYNDRAEKWLAIVDEDLSVAELLFNNGHWLYTGFMCHQAIEKTLKAYWCVCRDDDPPYIHYAKMSDEQKNFLKSIRDLYIEARYKEVKDAMARRLNNETTAEILEQTKQLHAWILERIVGK